MNGKTARLLAILALVVGLSLFAISSVSAHHPIVDGSAVCQSDGTWLITWTLRNSESTSGTNRWMDVDQINRIVTGIVVGTRVHPQGSATHPTGTISGTETLPGNTTGNITLTVRVDFQGDGPDNVVGSKTVTLDGSCTDLNLRVSHIECVGESIEVHFILNQLPPESAVTDYGSVSYTLNGSNRTAAFSPPRTGNAAHYAELLSPIDGVYTITAGSVTIQTTTGPRTAQVANVPYSQTITGCEQVNTASVTPTATCEGWSLTINASPGYTVTGETSGSWNGAWSVNYSIMINYASGTPSQFPFSGTITRAEECQTNTASVTPAVTCEGWSVAVNNSTGGTVTGATSGAWNGTWSVNYDITVSFAHGVPNQFHFTGTLTRAQECQQNTAEVTPAVTCEGWSLTINASPGYTVTGATSGAWNGVWSATYSIQLTYSNGVPPQFTFTGTVNRPQECQENFANVTPTANCVAWELEILASEGVSVQSGATAGVWQPGEWSVNYDVTLSFANGLPQTLHFTGTINRPAECQQNSATFTPAVTCEGWTVVVNATEGATITGATSGTWDVNGQGIVNIVASWSQGSPLQVPYTNVLNKPAQGCDPESTPEPTPEVTPPVDPTPTPEVTPPPTPQPPPPTYCIIPGSEAWDVDVSQLNVYGNPMVSRDQNTGVVNIHSLDAEVFIPGTRIPLTWADQTVYIWLTYNADRTCTPDPVSNPVSVTPEPPCPDCAAWVCEGFRTDGAEVVTFPLPGSDRFAVVARDASFEFPGAEVNVVHGNRYQILWYVTLEQRDAAVAITRASGVTLTPYGMPCSACIEEWGARDDGSVFYGWSTNEYEAFLALLYAGVERNEALARAHTAAMEYHADQRNGVLTPYGWYAAPGA